MILPVEARLPIAVMGVLAGVVSCAIILGTAFSGDWIWSLREDASLVMWLGAGLLGEWWILTARAKRGGGRWYD